MFNGKALQSTGCAKRPCANGLRRPLARAPALTLADWRVHA